MSDNNNVSTKKQDINDDNQHVLKNKPLVFFKDNNYLLYLLNFILYNF